MILEKAKAAEKITADDEGISAQVWHSIPGPERMRLLAQKTLTPNIGRATPAFREPTRHLSRLSPQLQAVESANAVPMSNFVRWLGDCQNEVRYLVPLPAHLEK